MARTDQAMQSAWEKNWEPMRLEGPSFRELLESEVDSQAMSHALGLNSESKSDLVALNRAPKLERLPPTWPATSCRPGPRG